MSSSVPPLFFSWGIAQREFRREGTCFAYSSIPDAHMEPHHHQGSHLSRVRNGPWVLEYSLISLLPYCSPHYLPFLPPIPCQKKEQWSILRHKSGILGYLGYFSGSLLRTLRGQIDNTVGMTLAFHAVDTSYGPLSTIRHVPKSKRGEF